MSTKRSILIVEDEIGVRRGLLKKINWEELDLFIMGEAQNAEEAYELIKHNQPDIILLDMRMPGMGGMKFLEILQAEYPKIKPIIISGHSDFEYARQALRYGASDYLLKPIIKEELKNVLIKTKEAIQEQNDQLNTQRQQHRIHHESITLLKSCLLNKLLLGLNLNDTEVLKRLAHLDIELNYKYYALAVISLSNLDNEYKLQENDPSLAFFVLENMINESVSDVLHAYGFKSLLNDNELIYIFGFEAADHIKEQLMHQFEAISENLSKYNNLFINVSISNVFENILEIPKKYISISHIWGKKKDHAHASILTFEDFHSEFELAGLLTMSEALQIMNQMEENDKANLVTLLQEIFHRIKDAEENEWDMYKKISAKIYYCMERVFERLRISLDDHLGRSIPSYNDLISGSESPHELKQGIVNVAVAVADLILRSKNLEPSNVISKVKEYIETYFFEDISLDFISRKFFLNSTYFSDLFKKKVGCGFNKYLNGVRIEKAKELLRDQNMKLATVAELVGFHDLAYFCIVFKKFTGHTPTEYRYQVQGERVREA
jgi:two-component system response regulator YesN